MSDEEKCSICNGYFKHVVVRNKHITSCNVCLRLIERKDRFEAKILEIDYMLFIRKDENLEKP